MERYNTIDFSNVLRKSPKRVPLEPWLDGVGKTFNGQGTSENVHLFGQISEPRQDSQIMDHSKHRESKPVAEKI